MTQGKVYPVAHEIAQHAYITEQQYQQLYQASVQNPSAFWAEQAQKYLSWTKTWQTVLVGSLLKGDVSWFVGGRLNACYNCVDRHLPQRAQQVAYIWEGDDPKQHKKITYAELHQQICRFANVLKEYGVQKGDRVAIYLPMIPEAAIAMLACARVGAIHSVVFAGFSAHALEERIQDADCRIVITADESMRGGKSFPLKVNVDHALLTCPHVRTVIVVKRTGNTIPWKNSRDVWYHEAIKNVSDNCPIVDMDANDPLFILYTSGSTGKPKGVLHGTGGYLLYAAMTHQLIFNYHNGDIYWCTADVGWVTGHSYIVYAPLINGATTVIFEGIPTYPTSARFWQIIDKHQVNIFYTAPTAIRALMREGDAPVKSCSRKSLRLMGSVGEPINPEVWQWYYHVVGDDRCPVVDTWWQTETGGILISPLPGATSLKPGSATKPFFGVVPGLVDEEGHLIAGEGEAVGKLVITQPWPGQLQTIYGNPERFINAYLKTYPGYYFTGDGAHRDADGYYWITGRVDDVINVSGHRLGTAEIESALVKHNAVAEAGVVGYPHDIKGQGIYAYVVLMKGLEGNEAIKKELIAMVREEISPIASPDIIQFASSLPKTRSGKIMRRILRKIAENELDNLGDTSTLADPDVVKELVEGYLEVIKRLMKDSKNIPIGTEKDGYTVEAILNRAYFHDCASDMLFDSGNPFTLFTSCFLCALTVELILKAWQLHVNKQFVKIHNLKKLIEDIPALTLTGEMQVFLEDIDKLYDLRYPWDMAASKRNKDVPDKRPLHGEAYAHAKEMKDSLITALVDQMPEDLYIIYEKVFFKYY